MNRLFTPMNGDNSNIPADIIEQAATWMMRLQSSELSPYEQMEHQTWLHTSQQHQLAWQRMTGLATDLQANNHLVAAPLARQALLSANGKQRRMVLKSIASISIAGGSGLLAWQQLPWTSWMADQRTGVGEQRRLTLADGTSLLMNTDSALDVQFLDHERRITLHHGEILIATAKDPRPMVVTTSNGTITPIGTRFSVRHEDHTPTRVMVTEGAVRLQPRNSANSQFLAAGMQAEFTGQEIATPITLNQHGMAWASGMLVVERMPLFAFIAELNRYHRGKLGCADDAANMLVSGAYAIDDTLAVIGLLQETLPLRIQYFTRYWITLHHL
ncbi:FecR family protein [Methylobacillus methanolivorans]|uniref:FecR family protein n=1 Tax=Methylobacillus methanolivorans TaxID=1848927 RepID=A0ABW8GJI6_9PROT